MKIQKIFTLVALVAVLGGCNVATDTPVQDDRPMEIPSTPEVPKPETQTPDLTYVQKLVEYSTSCQQISTIVDASLYNYEPENISDENVRTKINSFFNDEGLTDSFIAKTKELFADEGYTKLDTLCNSDENVYITFFSDDTHFFAARWRGDGFNVYDGMDGVFDLYAKFVPEVLPNGNHLMLEGYGDAGYNWWKAYSVDQGTGSLTLIEDCTSEPEQESPACAVEFTSPQNQ